MGYSDNEAMVRVDFWKESGKWYTTEAVLWTGRYGEGLIHEEFMQTLRDHFKSERRLLGMRATCLEPYHTNSHPISLLVADIWK